MMFNLKLLESGHYGEVFSYVGNLFLGRSLLKCFVNKIFGSFTLFMGSLKGIIVNGFLECTFLSYVYTASNFQGTGIIFSLV